MHDVTTLEGLGIPAVGVATTAFVEAAASQTRALGFDAARVFVAHPVQDRTDDELRTLAEESFEEVVAALTG